MPPKRIISLVPSQTELLFELGLHDKIVGITKFCVYPADRVKGKSIVGGTKTLTMERIHALRPDLIIANKEENTRAEIEYLQQHYPVHVTDMVTIADALAMIRDLGNLTGKQPEANDLVQRITTSFLSMPGFSSQSVAYFIWRNPYMVAANDTFIHSMLTQAGFRNAFAQETRYPEITLDTLKRAQPDLIFLSSEPYPFSQKHIEEFQAICPAAKVVLVDGEVFSWYGSRLLLAPDYFRKLRSEIERLFH